MENVSGQDLVYIGVPRERFFYTQFVDNLHKIVNSLTASGHSCGGMYQAEGHRVDHNRQAIVEAFMEYPGSPQWLLMLDSDMDHPPSVGQRLLRHNVPVVGGLYFHRSPERNHQPLVFREDGFSQDKYGQSVRQWTTLDNDVYKFLRANGVPKRDGSLYIENSIGDPLLSCDAVGTGVIMIHRSVFEQLKPPWFAYFDHTQSEDLDFCRRVKGELKLPIYVDMSVISGHYTHAAVGQAQFSMYYESRGLTFSTPKASEAVRLVSELKHIGAEKAKRLLESYHPRQMGELWKNVDPGDPEQVKQFYLRKEVGELYLLDLLHWSMSSFNESLRTRLMHIRNKRVLEIGGGIGTAAIHMAMQDNDVVMVEPNDYLRDIAEKRWTDVVNRTNWQGRGSIIFSKDIPLLDNKYDFVIAIDVLEHLHMDDLRDVIQQVSPLVVRRGRMFHHNNWGQQDTFPFHFDHSQIFEKVMDDAGFFVVDDLWSIKA